MSLTVKAIDALKPKTSTYRVQDEKNLYIQIKPTGAKSWMFRYTKPDGKRSWMGLGPYPAVSAAEARNKAAGFRAAVAKDIDPIKEKQTSKAARATAQTNTFAVVAEAWYRYKVPAWSEATASKCRDYLDKDILPALGARPIASIEAKETADLVESIEKRQAFNVAQKVRQWLKAIFSYAIAKGFAKYNPASELGSIAAKGPDAKNHSNLREPELPDFLRALSAYGGNPMTIMAARLVLLTACRPGVVRAAEWSEFDFKEERWNIPAAKMKMRRLHVVPLPRQAMEILSELRSITGTYQYLFPGQGGYGKRAGKIMSEGTINQAFARIGYKGRMTGHGSRHTASTLLNEHASAQNFDDKWIDAQLAHKEKNKEAPDMRKLYNHAEYLEHRRAMMQWYADYLDLLERGTVVPMAFRKTA